MLTYVLDAAAPSDYIGGQGDFTFKAGETKVSINITIVDDDLCEGDEIFYCDLTLPCATSARGVQLGSDNEATATICDDEPRITVNFAPICYTVSEDAGSVTLMLVASGPSSEAYSVFVNTSDGNATCESINECHSSFDMPLSSLMLCTCSYV